MHFLLMQTLSNLEQWGEEFVCQTLSSSYGYCSLNILYWRALTRSLRSQMGKQNKIFISNDMAAGLFLIRATSVKQ